MAMLCRLGDQELRIEMTKWSGEKRYAEYKHFKVEGLLEKYQLNVSGYSGDAGERIIKFIN